jgi:subtilisin-like proprotein convertase family protein
LTLKFKSEKRGGHIMKRQLAFVSCMGLFIAFVFSSTFIIGGCGDGGGGGGFLPPSKPTPTSGVALFANTAYVDYNPGNFWSEASNLEATLRAQGHTVTPFIGITASEIAATVSGKAVLAMPELENSDLNAAIDDAARAAIANFVNGGGTYLAFDLTNYELGLLNAVFGFSMTTINDVPPLSRNAAGTVGTPYENCGPPTLTSLSDTYAVDTTSLPAGAKVIYEDTNNNAVVTLIPVGSGNIVILGWDWYDARPTGSQEGGWWPVLYKAARLNEAMPDVAVIYSTSNQSWYDDVQAKLMATCQCGTVDLVDAISATPTLAELQAYDSLLVSSEDPFDNAVALGNNLADYVDAGGGLVLSVFSWNGGLLSPAGRFLSDNYYAIPAGSGLAAWIHETGDFALGFTSHPILAGVTNFDGGTDSFQPNTTSVVPGVGATRMANWNDGPPATPLVVTRDIGGARRADLGFWPTSNDSYFAGWVVGTDGDKLMANALTWAANWTEPSYATHNSTDTPMVIPDIGTVTSTITVSDGPTSISKVKVTLNITHTWDADLEVFLESPNGTMIDLTTDNGGGGDNYTATVFDDAAATAIVGLGTAFAPFTGSFIPEQPLAGLIGEDANGDWILHVTDDLFDFVGTLDSWSISIR